jgi:mRNA interferase RelE/StbE
MYLISYEKKIFKELDKIPDHDVKKIKEVFEDLSENPFPIGTKKLSGKDNLYRIQQGDYRIIYSPNTKEKQIHIILVKNRKDSYKNL